jgi:tetratricopeptide (TPR) repeat protein
MMINLKIPEERANLFVDLEKFQAECFSQLDDSNLAFKKLLTIWDSTSEILWTLGFWQDYLRCGEIVLTCASKLMKQEIKGRILNELGWVQMEREEFEVAGHYFSQSLEIFQRVDDRASQGQSLRYMGVLKFRQRYFGCALRLYQDALIITQDGLSMDPKNQRLLKQKAEIHNLLGNLYLKLFNLTTCRRELLMSLCGFRELQRLYGSPTISSSDYSYRYIHSSYRYFYPIPLLNLGRVSMLLGQHQKAQHYFDRCYQISEQIGRLDTLAGVLVRMAELAKVQGKLEQANELAEQAELVAGKEAPPTRNRAVAFRQGKGDRLQQLKVILNRLKMSFRLVLDLLINAPLVLVQSIGYYSLFLGMKLKARMIG